MRYICSQPNNCATCGRVLLFTEALPIGSQVTWNNSFTLALRYFSRPVQHVKVISVRMFAFPCRGNCNHHQSHQCTHTAKMAGIVLELHRREISDFSRKALVLLYMLTTNVQVLISMPLLFLPMLQKTRESL